MTKSKELAWAEVCAAIQHMEDALAFMRAYQQELEAPAPWSQADLAMRQARAQHDLEQRVEMLEDTTIQLRARVHELEKPNPRVVTAEPEFGPGVTTGAAWPFREARLTEEQLRDAGEPDDWLSREVAAATERPLPIEEAGVSP